MATFDDHINSRNQPSQLNNSSKPRSARNGRPEGGLRFDVFAALLSALFVGGLFLDGWAHNHGKVDQSFFTPWHAILYSGFAIYAVFLLVSAMRHYRAGYNWRRALPYGYGLSLAGAAIFGGGGVLDLIWHTLFGIEADVQALLSPTHLVLATGMFLMITGPLRAGWQHYHNSRALSWKTGWPVILTLALMLSVLMFFTQFAHPLVSPWAENNSAIQSAFDAEITTELGIASILLQTALIIGILLLALRRWTPPPGTATAIFTLSAILISFMRYEFLLIPAPILAGVIADILLVILRPTPERRPQTRVFAFAVPVVYFLLYFAALQLTGGVAWVIHLWFGAPIMAGIVGLFLSYLAVSPRLGVTQPTFEHGDS